MCSRLHTYALAGELNVLLLSGALSDECEAWHTVRYDIKELKSESTKANSRRFTIGAVVCCLREASSRHMTAHYEAACVSRFEFALVLSDLSSLKQELSETYRVYIL